MHFTEDLNPDHHRQHETKLHSEGWRRTGAHTTSGAMTHVHPLQQPAEQSCHTKHKQNDSHTSPPSPAVRQAENSRSKATTYAISLTFLLASSYFQINIFPKPDVVSSYLAILHAFLYTNLSSHPLNPNKLSASTATFGSEFLASTTSGTENISFCLL